MMPLLDEPVLSPVYLCGRNYMPKNRTVNYWIRPHDMRFLRHAYRAFRLAGDNPQTARIHVRILMTTRSVS